MATDPSPTPGSAPFEPAHSPGLGARVAGNSLLNMAGRVGSISFWVVVTPYLLHQLGPERFGLWALTFMFTTYMLMMDLGVGTALSRYAAEHRSTGQLPRLGAFFSTASTVYLVLGAVFLAAAALLGPALIRVLRISPAIGEARAALVLCALAGVVASLASLMNGLLQGFQRFAHSSALALAQLVPYGLGMWLVLATGHGLLGVLWVQVAVTAAAAAAGAVLVLRDSPGLRLRPLGWQPEAARHMLGMGFWVQLYNLVFVMQLQVDKLFLARWAGLPAVTSFELGFRVANGILALPATAFAAVTPAAVELLARGDAARLRQLHVRGLRWTAGLAAPLLAATWVAGPWLLRGWLGAVPAGSELALRFIAVSLAINLFVSTGTSILWAEARPRLAFYWAAAGLALHSALSVALVPRMGLRGALIAQLAATVFWVVLFTFEFHRRRGWSWTADIGGALARPVPVGAVVLLAARFAAGALPAPAALGRWTSLGAGAALLAAGVAAGLGALVMVRQFGPEDLAVVGRLAGRVSGRGARGARPRAGHSGHSGPGAPGGRGEEN